MKTFDYLTACAFSLAITMPGLAAAGAANPFAGRIYQAVAAAIVFVVVLVVLKRSAWGKILEGLQDRENKIRQDLEDAQTAAQKADETLKEYQSKLTEAQAEAQKIIGQSRTDAEKIGQQVKDDAQQQINQMQQRVANDIQAAKEQAVNELYQQIADLSTTMAGRILDREIKAEDQQQLIDDSLKELTAARN